MSEQETQTEKKRHILFRGQEGGKEDDDGFITMAVHMGHMWGMALQHKHPKFHENSMLCSMFGGYSIPHQLMQTFYDAEFETIEDDLHARITFKDAETRENVQAVMKAQKALDDALEKFSTDDWRGNFTNKDYIDNMRLRDEVLRAIEDMWWFIERLSHDSTTVEYDYDYGDGDIERPGS